jgi:hypothetical protein
MPRILGIWRGGGVDTVFCHVSRGKVKRCDGSMGSPGRRKGRGISQF